MKNTEKEFLKEFNEFMNSDHTSVPKEVSEKILQFVHHELNPSAWHVFGKLLAIHFGVGTLSLAVCDQFGMSPFKTGFSLSDYFMRFGATACMLICGFLFISLSVLMAWVLLKREELNVFGKNSLIHITGLGVISLLVFWGLGAEVLLQFAFLWLIGAIIGGMIPVFILKKAQREFT